MNWPRGDLGVAFYLQIAIFSFMKIVRLSDLSLIPVQFTSDLQ
jgi:hypothetical protein